MAVKKRKKTTRRVKQVRYKTTHSKLLVIPLGDVHYGAKTCQRKRFLRAVEFIRKTNCKVILMGDYLEFATRSSVGSGVYQQTMNPQKQLDAMVRILKPIRSKILVLLEGNHEARAFKAVGLDAAKILANRLGVPYGGYSCFIYLNVGKQNYTIHAQHGSTGARYLRTKMHAAMKTAEHTSANIYLYAHTHELAHNSAPHRVYDKRGRYVRTVKKHFVLTGGFLGYFGSYAEKKNMSPTPVGYPRIYLGGQKRTISVKT